MEKKQDEFALFFFKRKHWFFCLTCFVLAFYVFQNPNTFKVGKSSSRELFQTRRTSQQFVSRHRHITFHKLCVGCPVHGKNGADVTPHELVKLGLNFQSAVCTSFDSLVVLIWQTNTVFQSTGKTKHSFSLNAGPFHDRMDQGLDVSQN